MNERDRLPETRDDVTIRDHAKAGRYELFVGDQLAGLVRYRIEDGSMAIPHTEVRPEYEGRGLGSRLARFVLDDARRRGLRVVPQCPFIETYLARHPEYADLVDGQVDG